MDDAPATDEGPKACGFCGALVSEHGERTFLSGSTALICENCIQASANFLVERLSEKQFKYAYEALNWHFVGIPQDQLISTSRRFPLHMQADVQVALDRLLETPTVRFFGIFQRYQHDTLTFARLSEEDRHAPTIAPAQYEDLDIGAQDALKSLRNGMWLCRDNDTVYLVLLSFQRDYGSGDGIWVEITAPAGEAGSDLTNRFFAGLENAVNEARSYRGKILSLESSDDYSGRSKGIAVHRLPPVNREQVILPDATLELLDRNIFQFIDRRTALRSLGQSTKKGILLYGPPGSGKTHTIRYLATNLEHHSTLIITASQIGLLSQYMGLARLLQPAIVVIEDVDLIARNREDIGGPCEELMLNTLLNEMDGLKEEAEILFVLTTNRPEQLEGALSGRPGRIDQAIEIPFPDDDGREKLVHLYSAGLEIPDEVMRDAVARTDGVSAAFIKEMMRRTAQATIGRSGGTVATKDDLAQALDDMLFTGGALNVKLLGGAGS